MMIFLFAFGAFLLVIALMAVGYIFQQKHISGSCGGIGALGLEKACDCDNPCERKLRKMRKEAQAKDRAIAISQIDD